jgi:hypothetical protein
MPTYTALPAALPLSLKPFPPPERKNRVLLKSTPHSPYAFPPRKLKLKRHAPRRELSKVPPHKKGEGAAKLGKANIGRR